MNGEIVASEIRQCKCCEGCKDTFKFNARQPNRMFAKGHRPAPFSVKTPCGDGCGGFVLNPMVNGRWSKYIDWTHWANANPEKNKDRIKRMAIGKTGKDFQSSEYDGYRLRLGVIRKKHWKENRDLRMTWIAKGHNVLSDRWKNDPNFGYAKQQRELWADSDFRFTRISKMNSACAQTKQTTLEKKMESIITEYGFPFRYCGREKRDRRFNGFQPDFIGLGIPVIIETDGCAYHFRKESSRKIDFIRSETEIQKRKEREIRRDDFFHSIGFDVLHFSDLQLQKVQGFSDTPQMTKEEVANKIKEAISKYDFSTRLALVFE